MPTTHGGRTLEVTRSRDVTQLWPTGTSDADTATVAVSVNPGSFKYRASPTSPLRATHVFEGASVRGTGGTKPAINPKKHTITVRLQGKGAEELHYPVRSALAPAKRTPKQTAAWQKQLKGGDVRQYQGETCAAALRKLLGKSGTLECTVVSRVDAPNDVFDTYGRMVGNIVVKLGRKKVDVNLRLLELGLGVPGLYTSMDADELELCWSLSEKARKAGRGAWPLFSKDATKFDAKLRMRRPPVKLDAKADHGKWVMPKIFRRQSTWWMNKRAGMVDGGFVEALGGERPRVGQLGLRDTSVRPGCWRLSRRSKGGLMARFVFYSFHYDDIFRANVVRHHGVVKKEQGDFVGAYDASLWEEAKKHGDAAIKRLIDKGLDGTSVTAVLIGQKTCDRRYVKYEIEQSWARRKGLLGIYLNNIAPLEARGPNPFSAYKVQLSNRREYGMDQVIRTYDWVADNGYQNIAAWVEIAAQDAAAR